MDVRDMKGDPSMWERLSWADLSPRERELWTVLGWREAKWDRNDPPPSARKEWKDLSFDEQNAAVGLGFTDYLWNSFEDQ